MKDPKDVRRHRRKMYLSDRELEEAERIERELELVPGELIRELYMEKIRLLGSKLINDSERTA